jgi:hypothetical protein
VGRIVQCARCSNRWLQTVAAAAAAAVARDADASTPESEPGPDVDHPFRSPDAQAESPFPVFAPSLGAVTPPEKIEPVDSVPDFVIRPPRERTSLPAVIEPRRSLRLRIGLVVLLIIIVILAGAAVAGYFYRDIVIFYGDIVIEKMPAEWRTLLHLTPRGTSS